MAIPGRSLEPQTTGQMLPGPYTSLIGREQEIAEVQTLLSATATRIVTLTGPGGVGKTRIAIAVARAIAAGDSHTAVFVPLAPVARPSLVSSTIGAAFGLTNESEQSIAEQPIDRWRFGSGGVGARRHHEPEP